MERLDAVIFGASGFTGQFVVEHAARAAENKANNGEFTFGVAGRNEEKLRNVREIKGRVQNLIKKNILGSGQRPGGDRDQGTGRQDRGKFCIKLVLD